MPTSRYGVKREFEPDQATPLPPVLSETGRVRCVASYRGITGLKNGNVEGPDAFNTCSICLELCNTDDSVRQTARPLPTLGALFEGDSPQQSQMIDCQLAGKTDRQPAQTSDTPARAIRRIVTPRINALDPTRG